MKDFELFKAADCKDLLQGADPNFNEEHYQILANRLNHILNERGKRGFVRLDTVSDYYVCSSIAKNPEEHVDTHEALVFLRPIVEEKKCDHNLTYLFDESIPIGDLTKVIVCRPDKKQILFCPKCGEKL